MSTVEHETPLTDTTVTKKCPMNITCTLTVSSKYTSPQDIIEDAAKDGCVEYTMENCAVSVHRIFCNIRELIDIHGVFPLRIGRLVTGFGTQTPADRIAVIKKFVSEGGDVNADGGSMLLCAMGSHNDILVALFDMGARVCSDDGKLFACGGSVFNDRYNGFTENVLTLLKHFAHTDYTHAMADITSSGARHKMFEGLTKMPDASVNDYIIFIQKYLVVEPDMFTYKRHSPKCPAVIAALMMRCGISINSSEEFTKCVQAEHARRTQLDADTQEKLARLEKIEAVLKTADF